jgi:monoamine oxidase
MRIPANHYLLREYIRKLNIDPYLPFEMANKFIYLAGYRGGTTLTYYDFNEKLRQRDPDLLSLFPNLHNNEKGQTVDGLFFAAVELVGQLFQKYYAVPGDESTRIRNAHQKVTKAYDKYTLHSYLTDVAGWSTDALNLYDLGNAHVVFENGFIESWKDAFLSSNTSGADAGMQQLQNGMDQVPKAFISPDRGDLSLAEDISYGARVINITDPNPPKDGSSPQIELESETPTGFKQKVRSDYIVLSVLYTAQRAIAKSKAFSPAIEQAIRDVRYIEITKVLLQYSKRWWEHEFSKRNQGTDGGLISDLPIRYTMFPVSKGNEQFKNTQHGAIMAAYTFQ